MLTTRRILKNFVFLLFSQIVTIAFGLIVVAYLARFLGAEGFGKIGFAQAILAYFILLVNLGLDTFGTREVARNKEEINKYVNNILTIRLIASAVAFALLAVFVYFIPKPTETKKLILLFGLTIFTFAFAINWVFQGIEQMGFIAISRITRQLVYVGLIFWIIRLPQMLLKVPLIQIGAEVVAIAILFSIFVKKFSVVRPEFDFAFWKQILKQSLPMGFSAIMISMHHNFGRVMLGFIKGEEAVGWYNAAYQILILLTAFQTLINKSIFPHLSNLWSEKQSERLREFINTGMSYMFLLSLLMIVSSLCLGRYVITLIYGQGFQNSVIAFMLLAFTAFWVYNETVTAPLLYACDKQMQHFTAVAIGAVINLIFNVLLIPKFSYYGAAIATIIAEIFVFSYLLFFSTGIIKVDFKYVYCLSLISFFIPIPLMFLKLSIFTRFAIFMICFLTLNLILRFKVGDPVVLKLKQRI